MDHGKRLLLTYFTERFAYRTSSFCIPGVVLRVCRECRDTDEEMDEFGLAHFVEHMIFKGTEKRKSWHILNRMENVEGS